MAIEAQPDPAASPAPPAKQRPNAFESLRNRDFRLLTLSTISIGFGQWGQQIALGWLVFVLTNSAVQLANVAFIGGVLSLFLTPIGGIVADRYPRRTVIVCATLADTLQATAIAILVLNGNVEVWHVYLFSLLTSLTTAMNQPARQAFVADLMTPATLPNAIAMNSIAQNISRILGPSLAGVLTAASLGAPFVFVAAMRGLACINTLMMRSPARPIADRPTRNPLREIIEGFKYVLADPKTRVLLVVNMLPSLLVYPYISFMPLFARVELGHGSGTYGMLVSGIGVGSIFGLLGLAFLGDRLRRRGTVTLSGLIVYLMLVMAFTQTRELWQSLAVLITAGVIHGFCLALNNTLFQTSLRPDMRGRGMAAWQMGSGFNPFGTLVMGHLISEFGVRSTELGFFSTCLTIFVLILIFNRAIRRA
ncbi:MAG: MFS transporter [Chloroflexi bacterium]|nr:MAG: MFS transporter [Chloroflexota bacterium]